METPSKINKDVLIKDNLANYLDNIHIIKWGIIDLSTHQTIVNIKEKITCSLLNKNKSQCKSSAVYKDISGKYLCTKHSKIEPYITKSNYDKIKKTYTKTPIKELQSLYVSEIKLKKKDIIERLMEKHNKHIISSIKEPSKKGDISLITIGKNMIHKFDHEFNDILSTIEFIIIENQIGPLAIRMKTIQGMIAQYFLMKNIENIEFISSINKLKLFNLGKLNYKERKNNSINIINTKFIKYIDTGKWTDFFNKHTKKDDLADAFLQGMYFFTI